MPIKVACNCGQKFSARDSMAGKRVKCPKCNEPLVIPKPYDELDDDGPDLSKSRAGGLTDLLDEVGVGAARSGPVCPDCGTDMEPSAVICIECGFNTALGRKMYTDDSSGTGGTDGMSVAEQLLAKAERELDATPIDSASQDFGDGGDAWIIAFAMGAVAMMMVMITLTLVFFMDQMPQSRVAVVSVMIGLTMMFIGFLWMIIMSFIDGVAEGFGMAFCATMMFVSVILTFINGFATIFIGTAVMYPIFNAISKRMYAPLVLVLVGVILILTMAFFWPEDDDQFGRLNVLSQFVMTSFEASPCPKIKLSI